MKNRSIEFVISFLNQQNCSGSVAARFSVGNNNNEFETVKLETVAVKKKKDELRVCLEYLMEKSTDWFDLNFNNDTQQLYFANNAFEIKNSKLLDVIEDTQQNWSCPGNQLNNRFSSIGYIQAVPAAEIV